MKAMFFFYNGNIQIFGASITLINDSSYISPNRGFDKDNKESGKKTLSIERIKNRNHTDLLEKIQEAFTAVLPVILIVHVFTLLFAPVSSGILVSFLIGSLFVITRMGLFTLGTERSMTPAGSQIGTALTCTKKMPLILMASFIMVFAVTISEPDLQVLAADVPFIGNTVLIYSVSAGVGIFMMLCMMRIPHGSKPRNVL